MVGSGQALLPAPFPQMIISDGMRGDRHPWHNRISVAAQSDWRDRAHLPHRRRGGQDPCPLHSLHRHVGTAKAITATFLRNQCRFQFIDLVVLILLIVASIVFAVKPELWHRQDALSVLSIGDRDLVRDHSGFFSVHLR